MVLFQKTDVLSWKEVMDYRNELYGIAIIWIIFFHISGVFVFSSIHNLGLIQVVLQRGNIGVDVFLFLSAIGLTHSIECNSITTFYKHRFFRVVLPYLILAIPYFIWLDYFHLKDGIGQFLLNVTTLNYWISGDHPTWYVSLIIILYLIFPFLYRWDKRSNHISTVLAIIISVVTEYVMMKTDYWLFSTAERALSRIPVFLVGLLFAPYVQMGLKIERWQVLLLAFLGIWLVFLITIREPQIVLLRYLYCPISIALIISYSFLRGIIDIKILGRFLSWVGGLSLELYIIHVLIIRIIDLTKVQSMIPLWEFWLIIPVASLVCSVFLRSTSKCLSNSL